MIKKYILLTLVFFSLVFVQCNRKPLATDPDVQNLSDFESKDGKVALRVTGGKSPYGVMWSNDLTDTVVQGLSAGTYYFTITDARNKVLIDTILVTQPPYPVCVDIDGNSYKTAVIGSQVWMLENLRSGKSSDESMVEFFEDTTGNAVGYLYTWPVAMGDSIVEGGQGICPDGWHLPSDEEWSELTDFIKQEGKEFADVFEPQYDGFFNNGFHNQGTSVSYWSSSSANDNAWKRYMHKDLSKVFRYHEKKQNAISVRCVRD